MKKEKKRYFLVEYIGVKRLEFNTKEDLERNIDNVRKYNNRKTPSFIIGNMNVNIEDGKYVLYAHIYNKLTPKSTISDLDNYTSNFDEKGLISDVYDKLITANEDKNKPKISYYPDINIAYFEDKNMDEKDKLIRRIKYIPVLYNDDKKYLDDLFLDSCLRYHAYNKDFAFFRKLVDNFKYNHSCSKIIEEILVYVDLVENQGYNPSCLYYSSLELYKRLIYERAKDGSIIRTDEGEYQKSRRRQRDFGFFIKNYNSTLYKNAMSYTFLNNDSKINEMKLLRDSILKQKQNDEKKLTIKK